MRVTDASLIGDFLSSINRTRGRIDRLTTQLATQQRILRASDDPAGTGTLMRVNSELARVESFANTIVKAKSLLNVTADSLDHMSSLLGSVRSALANTLSSDDPSVLATLADQVDQYIALGADVANTRYDGRYIFGGTQTTTAPYVLGGDPPRYVYQGDARSVQYQIGEGITQVVNVSGAAAFGSTGRINLTGVLDRSAAVGTRVTSTVQITDGSGAVHDVVLTMQKTDVGTWSMSAGLPSGASGATLTGGTTTLRFDEMTGEAEVIARGEPLVLTPAGATASAAGTSVNLLVCTGSLIQADTGEGLSILGADHQSVSVFDVLTDLSERLRSGQSPTPDDVALLSLMQEVVNQEASKVGFYRANLASAGDALTARENTLLDLRSATQDVDLAEIALRLKQEQTMLDAALSAAANIIPHSLLNFLK